MAIDEEKKETPGLTGAPAPVVETDDEKVRRVADMIQQLLVKESCAMVPSITLQVVKQPSPIITP